MKTQEDMTMSVHLLDGNRRFAGQYWAKRAHKLRALAAGQMPVALYIGCADSRVVPNVFLDADPGELFVVRQIAAIVPRPQSAAARPLAAALEYALEALAVRHVVVCGHDRCGGLAALLGDDVSPASQLGGWLEEAAVDRSLRRELALMPREQATERFVDLQLQTLARYPSVAEALDEGRVSLHGWVYDMTNGLVRARNELDGAYRIPEHHVSLDHNQEDGR
jgi:carbonic anhydrase